MSSEVLDPEARAAALAAEVEALKAEVEALRARAEAAEALADHDALTPALNRRAFLAAVGAAMADARRHGEPACLIYLDLDRFKVVNDRHGHGAGDALLVHVARLLVGNVRESDAVGRLGGDEFAVLLRRADQDAGRAKAEAVAELFEAEPLDWQGEKLFAAGAMGVRAYAGQADAETWLAEADAAMFVRKRGGR